MKRRLTLVWIPLAILTGGCTLQPLSLSDTGPQLAPVLGIQPTDFRFISHGGFKQIPESQDDAFKLDQGMIALTDTDIWLLHGNSVASAYDDAIKIPIAEVVGVSHLPSQVQLKRDDSLVVIRMYDIFRYELDQKRSGEFCDLLTSADIPEFEVMNTFGFKGPFGPLQHVDDWPQWGDAYASLRDDYSNPIYQHPPQANDFPTHYPSPNTDSAGNDSGTQGGYGGGGSAAYP